MREQVYVLTACTICLYYSRCLIQISYHSLLFYSSVYLFYPLSISPKVRTIAQKIYGAADIAVEGPARAKFKKYEKMGFGHYPVCMAKTQYVNE